MKKLILITLLLLANLTSTAQTDLDMLILQEINKYRQENNLNGIRFQKGVWYVANKHTYYQRESKYMGHRENIDIPNYEENTTISGRFNQYTNIPWEGVGENCIVMKVRNETDYELAVEVVNRWKNSKRHNELMLSDEYVYGGVSSLYGKMWESYVGDYLYVTYNIYYPLPNYSYDPEELN